MHLVHDLLSLALRLIVVLAIVVPLERAFAARPQRFLRTGFCTDLTYYFFADLLPKLLMVLPLSALAWALHRALPSGFYANMAALPLWVRLTAGLVVGEIGFYWGHRIMHQAPALWRFHAIHHSAEQMDWLVNTRAHPVDLFIGHLSGRVPIYALGLAQPMGNHIDPLPLLFALTGSFWGFFLHANVGWRFGWLESVVATPGFHHWHHTNDGREVIDKNYASMLPFIDRLFGTFYLPRQALPQAYGIEGSVPVGFVEQLVYPFRAGARVSLPPESRLPQQS
jgi:sterol desaturase/sphingolipid hydroxylase (fatty acid hydroxylase superfamily)